jgi:hypothetical protein
MTHTLGRTPLDDRSARLRTLPENTRHSQKTAILRRIETHSPKNLAALDLCVRPDGHFDREE